MAPCSGWTTHTRHLHFAVMPNPQSPGYHAHTEHGTLHLSAPHLSSLPQPSRPHRLTVQCLPACHLTSLGTWSPQALVCSPAAHSRWGAQAGRLRVAPGWQNTGCLYSPATPRWRPNKSRAWAAPYVPPSSQRPGTLELQSMISIIVVG